MKKIAILTSGGDASTMNKCLSAFVTFASKFNLEVYFVYEGFKGLCENKIHKADYSETKSWYNLAGTKILSARFMEFKEDEYVDKAFNNLKNLGIDVLIVIGGDGSYQGAYKLHKKGFKVIGLPGTIDNDISSSKYTIGFDSSLNAIVQTIFKIKACMNSHRNIALVEIMGRHCVDLTVFAGIACEADILVTNENWVSPNELLTKISEIRKINKYGILILVNENLLGKNNVPSLNEYKEYIEKNSCEQVKVNVLGHLQRGGEPTAMDLVRATQMVYKCCELIKNEQYGKIVGLNNNEEPDAYDIEIVNKTTQPISRSEFIKKYI